MAVIKLNKSNFDTEINQSEKPVLIDFFATWCGPCRMVSPVVDEIADDSDAYKVCKVDVDEEPELAQSFRVSSIPTLIVIKDGQVVSRAVGARPKEAIIKMLQG